VFGNNDLRFNTSATNTVAVGFSAGYGAGGSYNNQGGTYIGYRSGYNAQTGSDNNTLLGYQAGFDITTGANNIVLGPETNTGGGITSGSGNILIGQGVIAGLNQTGNNQLNIGNLLFGTGLSSGSSLSTGNVGIGTTTPSAQLTTTGTVQFANFGAGTLQTDANGNLSVSSDERLKNIQGTFTDGLSQLEQLSPILYKWKPESGYDSSTTYAGFSAQNVQAAIPEAVGQDKNGYLTLQDRPIIAAAVNAIKEIATLSDTFKTNLTAWLGNAQNGIQNLFAAVGNFGKVNTQELCTTRSDGTQVCITNDQLAGLLSQAAAANPSTSVTSSGAPQASNSGSSSANQVTNSGSSGNANSTSPIISINGANPATITVGSTYADLGATITAPLADLNLGLTVVVDNATSTDGTVQIDTSITGTHTILYSVTDPSGLTGSAFRTVIVSPAQQTPPPANDNTTASPAANDNTASNTSATSTAQ